MKQIMIFVICIAVHFNVCAMDFNMENALRETYQNCVGIEDSLYELKKMAGINTAISAIGTGTGVGAVAVGVAKKNQDEIAAEIEIRLENLRKIESENPNFVANQDYQKFKDAVNDVKIFDVNAINEKYDSVSSAIENANQELERVTQKSKRLGNWRTGLLAGTTATGIAGTVISAKNKTDDDLENQINSCVESLNVLRDVMVANKAMGNDVFDANEILNACDGYKYINLSKINKRATGATVSSAIAATTGVTGTIVSAVANSQQIRDDNSEFGKQKEKNLNTSSNVLATGSTLASATSTIFNASQIAEIKKIVSVAEQCTNALE